MKQINNSQRLSFRLYDLRDQEGSANDIQEMWELDQDPEVMRYITKGVVTTQEMMQTIFIPRIKSYTDIQKGYGMWRVALSSSGEFIGEIIARPMYFHTAFPHHHDIELGWRFAKPWWGKGYATEAAKHVLTELAKAPEVKHFTAMADPDNAGSIHIMKKLGMSFVENKVHSDPLGDSQVDIYRLDLD